MNELSLFTGAGGGLLAGHLLGWTPIGYVEIDDYAQRIIAARIADGHLPTAPIFGDIRSFISDGYAASYQGMADVVSGGFPCQPFSNAGKQLGADDPRNMWPATVDVIRLVRPRYAFLENVPGILTSGYFGTILGDLAESGYDARWRILSAAELGAPHKRDRLWIVAYASGAGYGMGSGGDGRSSGQERGATSAPQSALLRQKYGEARTERIGASGADVADAQSGGAARQGESNEDTRLGSARGSQGQFGAGADTDVADAGSQGLPQPQRAALLGQAGRQEGRTATQCSGWATEPALGRVAHGVAHRVDRLRAIGNGQVPAVAAAAWRLLTEDMEVPAALASQPTTINQ